MTIGGWHNWMIEYPPDVLIEVGRADWRDTFIAYRRNIDPATNIYGLYWRLTGIGKEELAASVTLK